MAGVQRTRSGYGNEGRTKQLAASLSDFIRLFSLYYPTSPNNTTQHTKSLVMPGSRGGSPTEKRQALFPPPFTKRTDSQVLRIHRRLSCRSVSHPYHSGLYDPTFTSELQNLFPLVKSVGSLAQFSHFLSLFGNFLYECVA